MNLSKRVEDLERRAGIGDDEFTLVIIKFMDGEPDDLTGYISADGQRVWNRATNESDEDLIARVERDVRCDGCRVFVVHESRGRSATGSVSSDAHVQPR